MVKNNKLDQMDNSIALQNTGEITGNININTGLSLDDVTTLFNNMFSSKYPILMEEAKNESYKSISEFALNLYQKMSEFTEQSLTEKIEKKFVSADFQTLLSKTVEQVGVKSDKAPKGTLSNLLIEKLNQSNEDYSINYIIDVLKYMNKNDIVFLLFLSVHNIIFNYPINLNGFERVIGIRDIYNAIDKRYLPPSEKERLKTGYCERYKNDLNGLLVTIYSMRPDNIDIDLLSSTVLLGSGVVHIEDVLGGFKENMNKKEYSWEELFSDLPLYKSILEMFGGSISEPEYFMISLNKTGKKIVSSLDLNDFK
ncbi:hypothetical protein X808_10930 [Mannheimia varigena USDA-ARS-USMARC-1296]|uniref:Uncharacterized protein n=1 Tax=Mannheimia varigena USDA-ARS-USMARC-1296 TaxID=1433287 RepID=W0QAP5_9PAST|nr:LPO_1073/Vpar_1526 family protein [Mannheimia varigena]AHG75616.1 hypothetical protein X808_10930 [Mannheimia varigena USDA-ARS-USMARC-1296]